MQPKQILERNSMISKTKTKHTIQSLMSEITENNQNYSHLMTFKDLKSTKCMHNFIAMKEFEGNHSEHSNTNDNQVSPLTAFHQDKSKILNGLQHLVNTN
jgi:hypothetical protein